MILNPKGKLVRWAYSFSEWGPPSATTLCAFFWRAFFFIPLAWTVIAGLVGGSLWLLGVFAYHLPWLSLGIITVGVIAYFFSPRFKNVSYKLEEKFDALEDTVRNSTFGQGVKAIKGKVCPIIYFEE